MKEMQKNIRADKEGRYAEMSEHPPDKKAAENMKRKRIRIWMY